MTKRKDNVVDLSSGVKEPSLTEADELAKQDAARAMIDFAINTGKGTHRRADWAMNTADMYMCPNGHLQYNLTDAERTEMRARGEDPPPMVHDDLKCRQCVEHVSKLTDDPKQLQQKLGVALERCAALNVMYDSFKELNRIVNTITMFMSREYRTEIERSEIQHSGTLEQAVVHYLKVERRRTARAVAAALAKRQEGMK